MDFSHTKHIVTYFDPTWILTGGSATTVLLILISTGYSQDLRQRFSDLLFDPTWISPHFDFSRIVHILIQTSHSRCFMGGGCGNKQDGGLSQIAIRTQRPSVVQPAAARLADLCAHIAIVHVYLLYLSILGESQTLRQQEVCVPIWMLTSLTSLTHFREFVRF